MADGGPVLLDLSGSSSTGSMSNLEWFGLIAFLGTILFCAAQAAVAPRRTFCAEKNEKTR